MKHFDPFKKTERGILLLSLGTVFVCLFVFAAAISLIYAQSLQKGNNHQIIEQYELLQRISSDQLISEVLDGPRSKKDDFKGGPPPIGKNMIFAIYEDNVLLALRPNPYFSAEELPSIEAGAYGQILPLTVGDSHFRALAFERGGLVYQIFMNVDPERSAISTLNVTLAAGLLILIALAAGAATFLTSRVMIPVKVAYRDQLQFIQDASHEMRTPLAVIKSALDLMIRSPKDSVESHSQQVSQMMGELRNLEQLNHHLLMLSKEVFEAKGEIQALSLNDLLADQTLYYSDLAELQDKHFACVPLSADLTVDWDAEKMKRALTILLDNAFKYTRPGDSIRLSAAQEGHRIVLTVEDTGIGISENALPMIFKRFYRSPEVRGLDIDGSGIGLSLLKAISETLHFKISVSSQAGQGTKFSLEVPIHM